MISIVTLRSLNDALLRLPQVESYDGRSTLLAGITIEGFNREHDNAASDVHLMVSQLVDSFTAAREWRLLILIDNAKHSVRGIELERELAAIRGQLVLELEDSLDKEPNPAEVAQFYLFDLHKPVLQCLLGLPDQARISGFVLPAPFPHLVQNFCMSLRHRAVQQTYWKRDQVFVQPVPLQIELPHTSVDVAFSQASKFKTRLASKIVVCSVYAQDAGDAQALWLRLQNEFSRGLANPFVVVFGLPESVDPPPELSRLPCPSFTQKDVRKWVEDIVHSMKWQADLTERWSRAIVAKHVADETGLPIKWTYEQLIFHKDMLTQNRTEEAFEESLAALIGD